MPRHLVGCAVALPERWAQWPPGEGAAHRDRVAAELGSTDEARALIAAAVDWCDEREATPGLIDLAIWVPDPTTGVTAGVLIVVLADVTPGPDPAGRWLHDIRRKPRLRGIRVLHHDTAPARVNAGPTVLELLTTADKRTGQLIAQAAWRVFPDDADGAIGLMVRTPEMALTPTLVADSELIAQGVEPVRVGGHLTGQRADGVDELVRRATRDGRETEVLPGPFGDLARTVGISTGDAEHVPQLRADYWLDPDDDRGLVLLAFSSPLLPLRDDLVDPFDSIVGGLRPVHDGDATAGPTEMAA